MLKAAHTISHSFAVNIVVCRHLAHLSTSTVLSAATGTQFVELNLNSLCLNIFRTPENLAISQKGTAKAEIG